MEDQKPELLRLSHISKSFSGLQVLKDVSVDIKAGEVHVLLGENGAGKSTIIKIMTGAYTKDKGEIHWEGQQVEINQPSDAIKLGISTIYQELNLVPELTIYENIFLGREIKKRGKYSLLDRKKMKKLAVEYLNMIGLDISPDEKVSSLGIGKQQLVEISKSLASNAKLIIMDEPTASLSSSEVEQLLTTVEQLRARGIAIIYISHKLEELKRIGDRVTVLRDGSKIETLTVKETSTERMIQLMVGRNLDEKYPKERFVRGKEGLRVQNLRLKGSNKDVSFTAYQGEILGFSGLVGAGRTEVARGIFGVEPVESGKISVFGQEIKINSPKDAIRAGFAFITEDRKGEGLDLDKSLEFNISLASLNKFKNGPFLQHKEIQKCAAEYVRKLQVRPGNILAHARKLSGGNQQKVVIAKWLATNAKVFIFDEPTRGIDVGAKVEVYRLINTLVQNGAVVIVISSELPEILGICDRVIVMSDGEITAEFTREEANQENIMIASTGGR